MCGYGIEEAFQELEEVDNDIIDDRLRGELSTSIYTSNYNDI